MLFRNETNSTLKIAIGRGIVVEPGKTVEIDNDLARPRRHSNGSRRKSIIEQLAPQLVPADPMERFDWEQAPEAPDPKKRHTRLPSVESLVASGVPRGVAMELVKQAHQSVIDGLTPDKGAAKRAKGSSGSSGAGGDG
jgi:hypothetical protein